MKRAFAILTVMAVFVMLNGCSKCSQERPAEPPAVVEPPVPPPTDEVPPTDSANPADSANPSDATPADEAK